MKPETDIEISPYKNGYKAAVSITFDYESSAIDRKATLRSNLRWLYRNILNRYFKYDYDLSSKYGSGYANRYGAEIILNVFKKYNIHGTWFSIGHVLLKNNYKGDAYRINQRLPYIDDEIKISDAVSWRKSKKTFYHDPYSDYKKYPYYYLGDQCERLKDNGEDIQCHTFSHPYVSLENLDNLRIDIEDWQICAKKNGYPKAFALAFPFLSDCHYNNGKTILMSNEKINMYLENNIELFCRCGSKENEKPIKGFKEYNNSKMFYMHCVRLFDYANDSEKLILLLKDIADNGYCVDFWTHPGNVFEDRNNNYFEKFIDVLCNFSKNIIWIDTVNNIWENFKLTRNVNYKALDDSIIIINNNDKGIEGLTFLLNKSIIVRDKNDAYDYSNGRLIIRNLKPKEKITISITKNEF